MGMKVVNKDEMKNLYNQRILIRAHGEPPSTYQQAKKNNLTVIDATCPVVLKLQKNVRKGFLEMQKKEGQIVIFGKKGHAEVIGLTGQTNDEAIVISNLEEINTINFSKPLRLYAQTTQSLSTFKSLVAIIEQKYIEYGDKKPDFIWYDTICRQVSNREYSLKKFAYEHDVVIFVSDEKSSNGLVLFQICQSVNKRSYIISSENDLKKEWFLNCKNTGICGATSTPKWLMNAIAEKISLFE
jgi:4-hydroxy-3-methylbut-2-enyl diphosphate reductase